METLLRRLKTESRLRSDTTSYQVPHDLFRSSTIHALTSYLRMPAQLPHSSLPQDLCSTLDAKLREEFLQQVLRHFELSATHITWRVLFFNPWVPLCGFIYPIFLNRHSSVSSALQMLPRMLRFSQQNGVAICSMSSSSGRLVCMQSPHHRGSCLMECVSWNQACWLIMLGATRAGAVRSTGQCTPSPSQDRRGAARAGGSPHRLGEGKGLCLEHAG